MFTPKDISHVQSPHLHTIKFEFGSPMETILLSAKNNFEISVPYEITF